MLFRRTSVKGLFGFIKDEFLLSKNESCQRNRFKIYLIRFLARSWISYWAGREVLLLNSLFIFTHPLCLVSQLESL
jgi:hypothetical protein